MSKVLIVDDDKTLAGIIQDVLAEVDQSAVVATSAEDAFAILSAQNDIVTVLADYRLNGELSGIELLREAQSRDPNLRCILMSGDVSSIPEDLERLESEKIEVLAKPLRMKQLVEKLC